MDLIGWSLAVIAIVVGVWYGRKEHAHAREAGKRADEFEKELKFIKGSSQTVEQLSTNTNTTVADIQARLPIAPADRFPDNIPEIVKFIEGSKTDLCIMTDFIGYGVYSKPGAFKEYMEAIERAVARKVKVRFALYNLDTARSAIATQLPNKDYLEKERLSERCKQFFLRFNQNPPESFDEFRDAILTEEQKLKTERLPNVEIRVVRHPLVAFCWVRDRGSGCVFSLRNDGHAQAGLTFITTDRYISEEFGSVFQSVWDLADRAIYKGRW